MALLEHIQSSSLGAEDRDRVTRIVRVMLRLPEDPVQTPTAPEAPLRPTPAGKAKRHSQSANTSRRRQRPAP